MSESESTLPAVGATPPDFHLESSTGEKIRLSDFKGKQPVVLYFYPKADTPGCTTQACGFRDVMSEYKALNVAVLGISPDAVLKVKKFSDKFALNFPLLADADHSVAEAYGVWGEKKFMGKKYMGVKRTTFILGADGLIHAVLPDVKPDGHERNVLNWIIERTSTLFAKRS